MYASIHRYKMNGTPMDDVAELGWRLGAALAPSPGFVAAVVVVEASTSILFTIRLFEDRASLMASNPVAERWMAQHCGMLESAATDVISGEVVAQKGL